MLHIADLHIGATLNGYDLLEDQKYTLNNIISICKENNIKYLLLSGDIYDKYNPSNEAVSIFEGFLKNVVSLNIRTIIISGNHDSKARLAYLANFLRNFNVYIYTKIEDLANPLEFDDDKISFLPLPYLNKRELELYYNDFTSSNSLLHSKLVEEYLNKCNKAYLHVALGHNLFIGGKISDSERTLSVGGLDDLDKVIFKDFDYTALGHLHIYQPLGNNIYYSGSICKYSISEFNNINSCNYYNFVTKEVKRIPLEEKHNCRILKGTFDEILKNSKNDLNKSDFIHIELTDSKPIYDAYNRLSNEYTNLISIAYASLQNISNSPLKLVSYNKQDEFDIFNEFYQAKLGKELDDETKKYITEIIKRAREAE